VFPNDIRGNGRRRGLWGIERTSAAKPPSTRPQREMGFEWLLVIGYWLLVIEAVVIRWLT